MRSNKSGIKPIEERERNERVKEVISDNTWGKVKYSGLK